MTEGYLDFDAYIRQGEPDQREKASIWRMAIGLQAVDGLQVSEYLIQTAKQHIEGDITLKKAKALIDRYYQSESVRQNTGTGETQEADKVSQRITELLSEKSFAFNPTLGFNVANDMFAENSWYFRNALVRANYTNIVQGINYNTSFLERFFRNLLLAST